jgi:hypothetical protein
LESLKFDDISAARITEAQVVPLLAAYLRQVSLGTASITLSKSLCAETISGYLRAAVAWCRVKLRLQASINDPLSSAAYHPLLSDIIRFRQTWQQPQERREPYTYEMFQALYNVIRQAALIDSTTLLDMTAVVFDWSRLGVFTGSRAGEYGQTTGSGTRFSAIPNEAAAGKWAGMPVAFIPSDFVFLDKHGRVIPHQRLGAATKPVEVHIRFRFDKSNINFSIRKFRCSGHTFICAVLAATSIVIRALTLGVPENQPLGVRRFSKKGGYRYLTSRNVIKIMREACILAYPDITHYMRIHIHCIVAHSNRVTAAVALANAGLSIDAIAFRLRWSPASVQHYLRDCSKAIGRQTAAAISGATLI